MDDKYIVIGLLAIISMVALSGLYHSLDVDGFTGFVVKKSLKSLPKPDLGITNVQVTRSSAYSLSDLRSYNFQMYPLGIFGLTDPVRDRILRVAKVTVTVTNKGNKAADYESQISAIFTRDVGDDGDSVHDDDFLQEVSSILSSSGTYNTHFNAGETKVLTYYVPSEVRAKKMRDSAQREENLKLIHCGSRVIVSFKRMSGSSAITDPGGLYTYTVPCTAAEKVNQLVPVKKMPISQVVLP